MKNYSVKKSFNEVAKKCFASEAQSLDFTQIKESASAINHWVEDQRNHEIKELIKAESLDGKTRMVLVNAVYFKGMWTYPFNREHTHKVSFYLNEEDFVSVDFMVIIEDLKYGIFPDLDATVLELPFNHFNDISMLIILPNSRTGLSVLQEKLNANDLDSISNGLIKEKVVVKIPKFKILFDIQVIEPLRKVFRLF
jgi:serpin B